jgi:hypothetical protein
VVGDHDVEGLVVEGEVPGVGHLGLDQLES